MSVGGASEGLGVACSLELALQQSLSLVTSEALGLGGAFGFRQPLIRSAESAGTSVHADLKNRKVAAIGDSSGLAGI